MFKSLKLMGSEIFIPYIPFGKKKLNFTFLEYTLLQALLKSTSKQNKTEEVKPVFT